MTLFRCKQVKSTAPMGFKTFVSAFFTASVEKGVLSPPRPFVRNSTPDARVYAPAAPWNFTSTSLRSSSDTLNMERGFNSMKLATNTSGICPMRVL
jgi:hypothetical protein